MCFLFWRVSFCKQLIVRSRDQKQMRHWFRIHNLPKFHLNETVWVQRVERYSRKWKYCSTDGTHINVCANQATDARHLRGPNQWISPGSSLLFTNINTHAPPPPLLPAPLCYWNKWGNSPFQNAQFGTILLICGKIFKFYNEL